LKLKAYESLNPELENDYREFVKDHKKIDKRYKRDVLDFKNEKRRL